MLKQTKPEDITDLSNHLLVAAPDLNESPWARMVILMCAHDEEGSMGVIINKTADDIKFSDILEGMELKATDNAMPLPTVYEGGPVDAQRGFVLHSTDYAHESSLPVSGDYALSANVDIVEAIADNKGPKNLHFCLGYCGWGAGQIEQEIAENSWIVLPADENIIFRTEPERRYGKCLEKIGIDPARLSTTVGRA